VKSGKARLTGKAAYPGVVSGYSAFFLSFLILKENRVVEGHSFRLWESAPVIVTPLLLILLTAALFHPLLFRLSGRKEESGGSAICRIAGFGVFILSLGAAVLAGSRLGMEQYPFGRISPSGGFWLLMISSFFLMNGKAGGEDTTGRRWAALLPWAVLLLFFSAGWMEDLGFIKEFRNEQGRFRQELLNHLRIALRAVGGAVLIGVPAGILAWKRKLFTEPVFAFVNSVQTIPSLALFGLLIAPLALLSRRYPFLREMGLRGVGRTPALIALTLYALLPIVRNTYTSLSVIEKSLLEAGRGMGMTPGQLFFRIELPISLPIILSGIRVSMVQTTGNTTVAALIGAGGLGFFVFRGLEQAAPDLIIMGVIPIIMLVTLLDKLSEILIRLITPGGLEALYDTL